MKEIAEFMASSSAIVVAFVSGLSALAVSLWSTRGEAAALRKLKAMNEVIAGLPQGDPVKTGFSKARDIVAEDVAIRMIGERRARRLWAAMILYGVLGLGGVVVYVMQEPDSPVAQWLWVILWAAALITVGAQLGPMLWNIYRDEHALEAVRQSVRRAFRSGESE